MATTKTDDGESGMVRTRIDPALKTEAETIEAETIMDKLELDASDAVGLLYKQIAVSKGLPLAVRLPNATTHKALKDADTGRDLIRYDGLDDFAKSMTAGG